MYSDRIKWIFLYTRIFVSAFLFWMIFPFITNFLIDKIGVNSTALIMSCFGIISVLSSLIVGNLGDIIGNVKAIKYSTIINIILSFLMIVFLINNYYFAFGIAYISNALSVSIRQPAMNSLVYDLSIDSQQAQKKSSNLYLLVNISILLSPAIGSLLFKNYLIHILVTNIIYGISQIILFDIIFKNISQKKHQKYSLKNNLIKYNKLFFSKQMISFGVIIIILGIVNFGFIDNVQNIYILRSIKSLHIGNILIPSKILISVFLIINALFVLLWSKLFRNKIIKNTFNKNLLIVIYIYIIISIILTTNTFIGLTIVAIILPLAEIMIPTLESKFVYQASNDSNQALTSSVLSLYMSLSNTFHSFLILILINYNLRGVGILFLTLTIFLYIITNIFIKAFKPLRV